MTAPRLSLAMIVRDEAAMLPSFLEHARGLYDELCVVDTGSRDDTQAILRSAGAKLIERPWTGNFSAARNQSLELATGDWVMFLDPDEWVSPELVKQARALMDDVHVGAATLRMINRLPHGHRRESSLLRMFRRSKEIQFEHAIHEDITRSIRAQLHHTGRRLASLSGTVEHVGYVREHAEARRKETRDRTLLLACLNEDPLDLYSHFKLLELERFWGRWQAGREAADRARLALDGVNAEVLRRAHFGGELLVLISQALFGPDAKAALSFLEHWSERVQPSPALSLRQGELLEQSGQWVSAQASFSYCLDLRGQHANLQLSTTRPLLGLARLALVENRLFEAEAWVEQALNFTPHDPEALLAGAALAYSRRGAAGLQTWQIARQAAGTHAELHWALGEEALARGDTASALGHFERTGRTLDPLGIGKRMAQISLVEGRLDESRTQLVALLDEYPQAGLGVLICDLLLGDNSDLDLHLELQDAERELLDWTEVLRWSKRSDLLTVLYARAPSVSDLFPRWPQQLASALRQLGGHIS